SYTGPCPPSGQHIYRFTVQALDASGKVLASASASRPFQSH
ncbi:MAG: phospholipid-binding protein, partial [Bradyrhizobium sp.]